MLLKALGAARDLGRAQEIARVLIRHGFGDLARRTGLVGVVERAGRALHLERAQNIETLTVAQRARNVLEELGPTYVKLGQVLASRPDILGPEWVAEFSQLHEHVASVPYEQIREQLEKDLGGLPEKVFATFDQESFAAGSIAQVHRASLRDGSDVVVKVRRPGIESQVLADLRLLERITELVENEIAELRRYRPRQIARQFARTMKAELDLAREARSLSRIAENLAENTAVVVPDVVMEWTHERVLVQRYLEGPSAAAWLAGERPADLDVQSLVRAGADAIVKMVFVDGLYHADPHPGNVLFLSDGRVGLLDFGMVGRLSEERRQQFVLLLAAVTEADEDAIVDVMLDWSAHGDADVESLTQDAREFLDRFHGVPLGELDVTGMLTSIANIVRENRLVLPSDVAMLVKVFITLEGLGRALDPEFDMANHVEPAAREMVAQYRSPRRMARRGVLQLRSLMASLPRDVQAIVKRARRGHMRVEFDLARLEQFGAQIEHSANRVTIGLITSALIVGTSIAMTIENAPTLFGLPVFGVLGFITSFLIGVGLLWAILRSGRH